MSEVSMSRLLERFKSHGLYELQEVVGIWEIRIEGIEGLRIQIKVTRSPGDFYLALPDHIPRSGVFHPHGQNSAQEALEDTINRLLSSIDKLDISENDFELVDSF